ncbi:MAG: VIT1/CCC1 transporter family protein [Verrucomicrobiae bacterium]|nr:VIT1/CCC1 transporter family protein [Verrucomicrobiae bacterium]
MNTSLTPLLLGYQRNEITESHIYRRLARIEKSPDNRKILEKIADDEKAHYALWKKYTGQDVAPIRWKIILFYWIGRLLGLTFGIKLMERGEDNAQIQYSKLKGQVAEIEQIIRDENDHENRLLGMLDEERLRYVGSIVLGLNDALVELTGSLAGLTLALKNPRLIALSGLIVGIAAALSMAASEFLSTKTEGGGKDPLRSSIYTGIAYIITVASLIAPYLILKNPLVSLAVMMAIAVLIIALFNFYISVATDRPFKKHFLEMTAISLGVAAISFCIGHLVQSLLGVEP